MNCVDTIILINPQNMRLFFYTIVVTSAVAFLQPSQSNAQVPDSIAEALSYYPLEIGNKWQFFLNSQIGYERYPTVEVIDTTRAANGKVYYTIVDDGRTVRQERVDSTTATVFQYSQTTEDEGPVFLLPTGMGVRSASRSSGELICQWGNDREILGESRRVWQCSINQTRNSWSWDLVEGIGVGHRNVWMDAVFSYRLVFYRVGETESGIQVGNESQELPKAPGLSTFPNPVRAGQRLGIDGMSAFGNVRVEMISLLGKRVLSKSLEITDLQAGIEIPQDLLAGVYLISLQGLTGKSTTMVVVQN